MGFRLGRTYVLEFDAGTYLAGAVIRLRSASIETVEALAEMQFSAALPVLIAHVESWNLEDADGNPLPLEEEAVRANMEVAVRNALIREWYRAAVGASAPLDQPSSNGTLSPEVEDVELFIPMEPLSNLPES
jgi:hypothetical protein